jgi:hypothetical protein
VSPIVTTLNTNGGMRGRVRVPPAIGIPVSFVRFDAGTATTFYDWGMELAQGELLAANIANVSVWMNGTEIPVYVEALGKWPDGSARTLYIQAEQTGTKDTEIPGEVRLSGGFSEPRRSYVDRTDRWANRVFTTVGAYAFTDSTITVRNNLSTSVTLAAGSTIYHRKGSGFAPTSGDERPLTGLPVTITAGNTATLTFTGSLGQNIADDTGITIIAGSNKQTTVAYYRDGGAPEGVIVSTDPTRLCTATSSGYLMPQTTETVFTENGIVSSDITARFDGAYDTTALHPSDTAIYERGTMMWHKFCRTGNLRYLRDFCGYTSAKKQDIYGGYIGPAAEWEYENITKALMYLFRRDTVVGDQMNSDAISSQGQTVASESRATAARSVMKQAVCMWMGYGLGPSGVNFENWVANTQVPKYVADATLTGGQSLYMFDNNRPQSRARNVHVGIQFYTYPYMSGLYLNSLQVLHDALPASYTTARTSIASKVSAAIDYMLGSSLAVTRSGTSGLPSWHFSDVDVYIDDSSLYFAIEVAADYTAGAGTISLKNVSGVTKNLGSARCLGLNGTDSAIPVGFSNWLNNETRTVTLTSPFASSHVTGTTGYGWVGQAATGLVGATPNLDGFWPHVFAWDWWVNGDTTSRDKAKQFFCAGGLPTANGGPDISFNGKQFSEAYHLSQQTPAILAKRT